MTVISSLFLKHLTEYNTIEIIASIWSFWITIFILVERGMFQLLKRGWKIPILLLSLGKKLVAFSILSSYIIVIFWGISFFPIKLYAFFIILFYMTTGYIYNKYILRLLSSIITVILLISLLLRGTML
ncbi:MAG: hypothetical protein C0601_11395 [Candidatus Muiribacterium halophilum]|uniref:Uncharacterized protein n=1 Tax=Muiribacterium halophilum TaxID=2053465 RepID=A0A2N5ZC24_MUIH1|nr:MAG: hypothetical protein C0601_11395 [Candidatus Muirbacterium halophilum]